MQKVNITTQSFAIRPWDRWTVVSDRDMYIATELEKKYRDTFRDQNYISLYRVMSFNNLTGFPSFTLKWISEYVRIFLVPRWSILKNFKFLFNKSYVVACSLTL